MSRAKRILLTTLGSHGDLNPYVVLGLELKRRGHTVRIATTEYHRARIEPLGIEFHPLRPDVSPSDRKIVEGTMDPKRGPEFILGNVIFPALRDTFADTEAAARGADLLVSHVLTLSTPLVAERDGKPWVSTALSPIALGSIYDPPVLGGYEWLGCIHALGPTATRALFGLIRKHVDGLCGPFETLRRELGLKSRGNPVFKGQFSPHLALVLYSSVFGGPQPDWPAAHAQPGFLFHDEESLELSPQLERFLDAGAPPVVFTLGTAAVHVAGDFYAESARAVRALGRRAVFLIGKDAGNSREGLAHPDHFIGTYEPYARVFERAAAIVHQGGIGTTAQALRSGRPMLVVPFGNDQSDNAARAARLGAARSVLRPHYTWRRAAYELGELVVDARYAACATDVGRAIAGERALERAADAIERLL